MAIIVYNINRNQSKKRCSYFSLKSDGVVDYDSKKLGIQVLFSFVCYS